MEIQTQEIWNLVDRIAIQVPPSLSEIHNTGSKDLYIECILQDTPSFLCLSGAVLRA